MASAPKTSAQDRTPTRLPPIRLIALCATLAVLAAVFARPLLELARFCVSSELFSYIFLIPPVSAYLIWIKRSQCALDAAPAPAWALIPLGLGIALSAAAWRSAAGLSTVDGLALWTAALLALSLAAAFAFLGLATLRTIAFPLGFLVFCIPLPAAAQVAVENFLRVASADVADAFLTVSFSTFWRQGLLFHLPDISIEVAPECSGIHASLVLLITAVLAAHLFLRSGWRKALLVVLVLPIAIVRNGFRIFVIAELCVHIGPQMINSAIHRHGGPIFFAISLVGFLWILAWLRRSEVRAASAGG